MCSNVLLHRHLESWKESAYDYISDCKFLIMMQRAKAKKISPLKPLIISILIKTFFIILGIYFFFAIFRYKFMINFIGLNLFSIKSWLWSGGQNNFVKCESKIMLISMSKFIETYCC